MKLDDCVANYIEYKRGLGMRFITEDRILRAFCRAVGDASTASVSTDQVLRFLLVNGERTRFWEIKYSSSDSLLVSQRACAAGAAGFFRRDSPMPLMLQVINVVLGAEAFAIPDHLRADLSAQATHATATTRSSASTISDMSY